jgi:acyl-CoA synthetase (AMP-forming)/AMP-acid ligase II
MSIWEAYETTRDGVPQLYSWQGSGYVSYTWDDWRRGAQRAAVGLRALGVEPGSRVAAVLTNSFDVCAAVLGTWLAGATLLSLPALRRGQEVPDYLAQLRRLCRQGEAQLLLLEERFLELLDSDLGEAGTFGVPTVGFAALGRDGPAVAEPPAEDQIAFVQYSSGSVSDPKGCMLSMGAICAQERMLQERLGIDGHNRGAMWLPLSHDMGLFGCILLGWTTGMRVAISPPERFLRKPQTWMEDLLAFDSNIAAAPNFALALAARWVHARPPKGRPMRFETIVLGAERIEWSTLREADAALGPYGLNLLSMTPAYGLAEATLAVTVKHPGEPPHVRGVDTEALQAGELIERPLPADTPDVTAMVSCGSPVEGVHVRIEGDSSIGRICVKSPALTAGYLGDRAQTERQIVDGELRTEDFGFLLDGELYVIGRLDDVIPIGGRNVHTRDVELALNGCEGVRAGCATLIDLPGGALPQLVMVCEAKADAGSLPLLADGLASKAFDAAGVRIDECVFVRPGALPKTPSGKIQRYRCRTLVQQGNEAVLERVAL